mmetsp:Transcript_46335/g.104439  ORF Transcript_46335/g.104439 Transcript_46335/m.104439 type:complete len:301 (-) Transcript_46335:217-1119(-)|eukprot:CAMPEP_0181240024 /NCGR_PEP_ID=MMETSP1096-20121128/40290_1 /TAXON_ID=156174 ORGANISM="Chrysochromulina ericina, Strain CCMP281" /NCGR_SAMPLE_ID=MMETSP1096 /ASSEMBLY_ACC=CAM_ASM_000453 /LENGTH=300 /DNA_ID=CAMNT_0023335847 /DNA_START=411 /DNA_END=1313 /DNA_ORIENTATION=-
MATHVTNQPSRDKEKAYDPAVDGEGVLHAMTAPLLDPDSQKLIGVIQMRNRLWHRQGRQSQDPKCVGFCEFDRIWMEKLAKPFAFAIRAAERKEMNRLRRCDAMLAEKRAHAIMTVTGLAGSSEAMTDLTKVFTIVVQEIEQLLNCDRATFWRVGDGNEATLWTMVQPYPPVDGAPLIRIEVPMREGTIAGSCVIEEECINIADVYEDPRFDQRFDQKTGYRTRSMLAIPIQDKRTRNIKGCIQCMNKENAEGETENVAFNQEDMSLGYAFANVLAVALEQQAFEAQAASAVDLVVRNLV